MFLMIDNYDSFVYNLVRYFEELGEIVKVRRNDSITIEEIKKLNPKGIIISPGPKNPKEAGICLEIIEEFKETTPLLGICLGHQCIAHLFGADVVRGKTPIHGKISRVTHDGKGVFRDIKNPVNVTRYHSLVVDAGTLPKDLEVTAKTEDGVIMGIRHKRYNIEGVQFHPEAELTENGHEMLKNFINLCKGE